MFGVHSLVVTHLWDIAGFATPIWIVILAVGEVPGLSVLTGSADTAKLPEISETITSFPPKYIPRPPNANLCEQ